jgi:hypothetical protein
VPKDKELRNQIMVEAYSSKLSIHPSSSKMYQDLKPYFWWTKMKKEIATYVARCDNYCRVKTIHIKPGLLQPLSIPGWKWEEIVMDFIVGLTTTERGFDSILVIVDRLTKSAHFIPVKTNYIHIIMRTFISNKLYIFMVCPSLLSLIENLCLQLTFGSPYIKP